MTDTGRLYCYEAMRSMDRMWVAKEELEDFVQDERNFPGLPKIERKSLVILERSRKTKGRWWRPTMESVFYRLYFEAERYNAEKPEEEYTIDAYDLLDDDPNEELLIRKVKEIRQMRDELI